MYAFLEALGHLLLQSLNGTVGWMGTTLLAVAAGLVAQFVAPWVDQRLDGVKPEAKSTFKRIRGSVVVALSLWIAIYGVNVVYTVYHHHQIDVKSNQALAVKLLLEENDISQLKAFLQKDEDKIKDLTDAEPADSLRRRTMRVADEWRAYLRKRVEVQPPFAALNTSDPNPSEETKKAIQVWQNYVQETNDYYTRNFRGRMLGIIKEYESKGVPTHYLESNFQQFAPGLVPAASGWEDSPMDVLSQFRDLAYRVDARDHLIVF